MSEPLYKKHDYLDSLMTDKETECVEFKHGKGCFPSKSFWESYSSLANTEGGVIIIGVKGENGVFTPEELTQEQIDEYEKIFWDGANNATIISRNLLANRDVLKGEYEGNHIIMFFIPRASLEDRKTGKEELTLSNLLMFVKIDSIMDTLPHYMIDYREYTPTNDRWSKY